MSDPSDSSSPSTGAISAPIVEEYPTSTGSSDQDYSIASFSFPQSTEHPPSTTLHDSDDITIDSNHQTQSIRSEGAQELREHQLRGEGAEVNQSSSLASGAVRGDCGFGSTMGNEAERIEGNEEQTERVGERDETPSNETPHSSSDSTQADGDGSSSLPQQNQASSSNSMDVDSENREDSGSGPSEQEQAESEIRLDPHQVDPTESLESNPVSQSDAQTDSNPQIPGAFPSTTEPDSTSPSTPRVKFFRLPYLHPDGSPALLEFTPAPLPSMPSGSAPYVPSRPMFVPRGASPLPFGFIFDPNSSTAWSVLEMPPPSLSSNPSPPSVNSNSSSTTATDSSLSSSSSSATPASSESGTASAGSGSSANPTTTSSGQDAIRNIAFVNQTPEGTSTASYRVNPNNPRLVAGPPFHVMIDFTFGGQSQVVEELDPKRAERFCESLEKADAELRGRMSRVGLGELGIYGGQSNMEGCALGCAVCLEQYMDDDRPAWLDSSSAEVKASDSEVVCVPCEGHHTLHRGCLKDWLANTKPSKWACPFCRGLLSDGEKLHPSLISKERLAAEKKQKEIRSLREEVRFRERRNGWRCDSRACIGCFPESSDDATTSGTDSKLLLLKPCKHEIHLDCLMTELKVHDGLLDYHEEDEEEDDGEEEEEEAAGQEIETDAQESTEHSDMKSSLSEEEVEKATQTGSQDQDTVMSESQPAEKLNDSGIEVDQEGTKEPTVDASFIVVTKGKWITCPCCRKESWAELPMKKRIKSKKTV